MLSDDQIMQLLQQEYKNFEQKQKEISVPQDSIPDFSDPKVKQAWVIFQELLKEKCLPPQRPQQPIHIKYGFIQKATNFIKIFSHQK